jgi:hypothetical protein
VCQRQDRRISIPGFDFCERVGASDEKNLRRGHALARNALERPGGIRGAFGCQLRVGYAQAVHAVDRERSHREAVKRGRGGTVRAVGRRAGGHDHDGGQPQHALRRGRCLEVPGVDGIERASQDPEPFGRSTV